MFTLGQRPRGNPSAVRVLSKTKIEAINREPQRVATGATAAPTPTNHSTAYPGGGTSKEIMAVESQFFNQLDRPNPTRTERSTQNTLQTSIAASPSLVRPWHFRTPSAHPRHPEGDSCLDCAAERNRGWRRRARDLACLRSRLLSSTFVRWAL